MKAKRKRHSAAFKAKVGFEALVGLKTVAQLARDYAVDPAQVTARTPSALMQRRIASWFSFTKSRSAM